MSPAAIALALQLAEQGLTYWTQFIANAKNGSITEEQMNDAASKLGMAVADLEAARAAQVARLGA